jgi:SulP family sulfate permease
MRTRALSCSSGSAAEEATHRKRCTVPGKPPAGPSLHGPESQLSPGRVKPKLLTTLRDYNGRLLLGDALAGITVALVALPLSIAIAIASGADPKAGLVTAIVGGLLISLLGGSRVQIGGPTGAFIVVVYGVIAEYGYDGLLLATLMAGVILVIGAILRAGRFIRLVPEPVIEGFTIGIALIIAVSQLKDLLGLSAARVPADLIEALPALWAAREAINPVAMAVGLSSILGIALLRRVAPRVPGSLLVIAAASAAVALLFLPVDTIQSRFGALPAGLPMPSLPHVSLARTRELLPSAFVIAFLAAIESLLSAIVADRMIGGRHRSNAELLAQGAANIVSPLFGGLPATGAIARTATNVRAGGKTPVAGIVHALVILLVTLGAARLAGYLAMPALAGLLIVTAWIMSEPGRWGERMKLPPRERILLLLTMILTVFTNLTVAIAVGTLAGLALRLVRRDVEPAEWTPSDRSRL